MNKQDLINDVSTISGQSRKTTTLVVNALIDKISDALAEGVTVSIFGFGTFGTKHRAPRKGRNPKTGQALHIEGRRTPVFKAGKSLKEQVK